MDPNNAERNVTGMVGIPIKNAARIVTQARGRKSVPAGLRDPSPLFERVSSRVVRKKEAEARPARSYFGTAGLNNGVTPTEIQRHTRVTISPPSVSIGLKSGVA